MKKPLLRRFGSQLCFFSFSLTKKDKNVKKLTGVQSHGAAYNGDERGRRLLLFLALGTLLTLRSLGDNLLTSHSRVAARGVICLVHRDVGCHVLSNEILVNFKKLLAVHTVFLVVLVLRF